MVTFKEYFLKVMKDKSVLHKMKEEQEAKDKKEFLRILKDGHPKPRRRTRPPVRLTASTGPK